MNETPQNIQVRTESVQNIADSIRSKNHSNQKYKIGEMSGAIDEMKVAIPNTMLTIEHNGVYDVSTDEKVSVEVPVPTGSYYVYENGHYDISQYASVDVEVPEPTGEYQITANGLYNIKQYEQVKVNVPQPSGSTNITTNGTHDVTNYVSAIVNVPMPKVVNGQRFQLSSISASDEQSFINSLNSMDFSSVTSMEYMFSTITINSATGYSDLFTTLPQSCKPTSTKGAFYQVHFNQAPSFDTSLCTTMEDMFRNSYIVNVPIYNTSSIQTINGLKNMYSGCNSLSQTSIDNIMQMCMNCSFTGDIRTLFNAYPTGVWDKIHNSQYYQAFLDSGWTVS